MELKYLLSHHSYIYISSWMVNSLYLSPSDSLYEPSDLWTRCTIFFSLHFTLSLTFHCHLAAGSQTEHRQILRWLWASSTGMGERWWMPLSTEHGQHPPLQGGKMEQYLAGGCLTELRQAACGRGIHQCLVGGRGTSIVPRQWQKGSHDGCLSFLPPTAAFSA